MIPAPLLSDLIVNSEVTEITFTYTNAVVILKVRAECKVEKALCRAPNRHLRKVSKVALEAIVGLFLFFLIVNSHLLGLEVIPTLLQQGLTAGM